MIIKTLFDTYYEWWKNIDKKILSLIIILFSLGLFFSLVSTSIIASDKLNTNSYYFFFKHLAFISLGIFVLLFFSFFEKKILINFSVILFLIGLIFLILVPFIGTEVKGSKRWIDLGILPRFQPIELLKPFIIVVIGIILNLESIKNIYLKHLISLFVILPIITLLAIQPDIGQTLLIITVWFMIIFVSGINLILLFSFSLMIFLTFGYLIFFVDKFSYIKFRLFSFIDPSSGNSYQSEKAADAITSGGIFGKGIGEGTLNNKVPEAHTDYIISVISEEFGISILIFIMLIFIVLCFVVMKKIDETTDDKAKIILLGCLALIITQSLIHIGVNIRVLPTTGMTLPFLSYGGSSILSTSILSGIILNLTKRKIIY